MKMVFLDSGSFPAWIATNPDPSWQQIEGYRWQAYEQTVPEQIVERAAEAAIIVTNKVPLTAEIIAQLPNLQMVAVSATGYNIIDMEAATAAGIVVCNVQEYANTTLAEHTLALILTLSRDIKAYDRLVNAGAWQRSDQFCLYHQPIQDLSGKQLGIIGGGSLGQAVAKRAAALGMVVLFAGRKGQPAERYVDRPDYVDFDTCLRTSDVISIHCPLTCETANLIDKTEFAMMDRQPLVINTARGGIVNESAAVTAIDRQQIRGLGFDVLVQEPPRSDNPLLAIADRDNVIITPHVAWASTEAMGMVWMQTIDNINGFIDKNIRRQVV